MKSTLAKVIAAPFVLILLVLVVVSVDDLVRGGGACASAIYDKSAVVFDAVTICCLLYTSDAADE